MTAAAAVPMTTREAFMLGRLAIVPDLSGALFLPEERTLVVADLHLEKGSSYAMRGVMLPPYDTTATLAALSAAILRLRPARVIALGELPPIETPHRLRVTLSAANATVESGEAVSLRVTLRPPPEPISPNGFDFGRKAWFDRLGATGYAIGKIVPLEDAGEPPWDLRAWAAIDHLRSLVTARSARAFPANAVRSPRR